MALGDVIMTEPVLRYFYKAGHLVNIITNYDFIFENSPYYINHQTNIDFNLDGVYEQNRYKLTTDAYFEACGIDYKQLSIADRKPCLYIPEVEIGIEKHSYVLIHNTPCPTGKYRNVYTDYNKIFDYLKSRNINYILIEPNKYDFKFLCSLVRNAKLFIGLDSSPAHIAQVYDIPSIIFMGNVNPAYRYLGDKQTYMFNECENQHCYHSFNIHPPMNSCCDKEIDSMPKCTHILAELVIENIKRII